METIINLPHDLDANLANFHILETYIKNNELDQEQTDTQRNVLGIAASNGHPGEIRRRRVRELISISAAKETGMSVKELLMLPCHEYRLIVSEIKRTIKSKSKSFDEIKESMEELNSSKRSK